MTGRLKTGSRSYKTVRSIEKQTCFERTSRHKECELDQYAEALDNSAERWRQSSWRVTKSTFTKRSGSSYSRRRKYIYTTSTWRRCSVHLHRHIKYRRSKMRWSPLDGRELTRLLSDSLPGSWMIRVKSQIWSLQESDWDDEEQEVWRKSTDKSVMDHEEIIDIKIIKMKFRRETNSEWTFTLFIKKRSTIVFTKALEHL